MSAGLWMCVVLAGGSADPVPADLHRFGLVRSPDESPWGDPGATRLHRAAVEYRERVAGLRCYARWWGLEAEHAAAVADAEWRLAAWRAAWWATDRRFDPTPYLAGLRAAVGPAYYRLGVMPAPRPGLWRE